VQVSIINNTNAPYSFYLADDRAFSIDFNVRTLTNRLAAQADALARKRAESRHVYFRQVNLGPGETFSFVEDLRRYAALSQSGAYVVQAYIYPDLYHSDASQQSPVGANAAVNTGINTPSRQPILSNTLALNVRPPALPGEDGLPQALDEATGAILVREKLPPDQVVHYMLTARQKAQWEKFFLYLDLERMIERDSARARQWERSSEEGRQVMLSRYRRELQSAVTDGDISMIPIEFEIERTSYNAQDGSVVVLEKFRTGMYTEVKRFTYYFAKKEDNWTIVDYVVMNLGTE
jgi:hypothetical protein